MLNLKLAWRFIIKRPLQNIAILLTIIVSVGAQLFIVNLSSSLNNMLEDLFITNNTHVSISNNNKTSTGKNIPLVYDEELIDYLDNNPLVKDYAYSASRVNAFSINGVLNDNKLRIDYVYDENGFSFFNITENMIKGRLPNNNKEIVILDSFLNSQSMEINDELIFNHAGIDYEYTIVGSFQTDSFHANNNRGITYSINQTFSALRVFLKETDTTSDFIEDFQLLKEEKNLNTNRWDERIEIYKVIEDAQYLVLIFIQAFLSGIVFFIISSILTYTVTNMYSQIGILKALGFKQKNIKNIFLTITTFLLSVGLVFGIIASNIGLNIFQKIMTTEDGFKRIDVSLNKPVFLLSLSIIVVTVYLSTLYALRKTKKVTIIDIIKGAN